MSFVQDFQHVPQHKIDTPNGKLHYWTKGEMCSENILFVIESGYMTSNTMMHWYVRDLSKFSMVLATDQEGMLWTPEHSNHGFLEDSENTFYAIHHKFSKQEMKSMKVILIGYSRGHVVSTTFASKFHDKFQSIDVFSLDGSGSGFSSYGDSIFEDQIGSKSLGFFISCVIDLPFIPALQFLLGNSMQSGGDLNIMTFLSPYRFGKFWRTAIYRSEDWGQYTGPTVAELKSLRNVRTEYTDRDLGVDNTNIEGSNHLSIAFKEDFAKKVIQTKISKVFERLKDI